MIHREWEPHLRAEEILQINQACITALLHQGSRRTTKIASVFPERSPQATWREHGNHLLSIVKLNNKQLAEKYYFKHPKKPKNENAAFATQT